MKICNLTKGMNSGVCAARSMKLNFFSCHQLQDMLNSSLYRAFNSRLALPSFIMATIIFQNKFNVTHKILPKITYTILEFMKSAIVRYPMLIKREKPSQVGTTRMSSGLTVYAICHSFPLLPGEPFVWF